MRTWQSYGIRPGRPAFERQASRPLRRVTIPQAFFADQTPLPPVGSETGGRRWWCEWGPTPDQRAPIRWTGSGYEAE